MTEFDLTWEPGDEVTAGMEIAADVLPRRAALTAPIVILREATDPAVLLVDPHPDGTWNTWMFPYSSIVVDCESLGEAESTANAQFCQLGAGSRYRNLEASLRQLRDLLRSDYLDAIMASTPLAGMIEDAVLLDHPVYENFSLKYSKTSHSYTAYIFSYYEVPDNQSPITVPHIWVRPGDLVGVTASDQFRGRQVSDNVLHYLQHGLNK